MNASRVLRSPALGTTRRVLVGPAPVAPPLRGLLAPTAAVSADSATTNAGATNIAFDAGRAEGLKQGLTDAQTRIEHEIETRWQAQKTQWEQAERCRIEEHQQRLGALDAVLQTLQNGMPERFMALERQVVELAYGALCRVCGPHTEQSQPGGRAGLLADLLRQGMQHLRGHAWLGVRLNARDHTALMASETGRALAERHPQVRFAIDAALEPLSVLVETDHGQLDVSLLTQLARLRDLWARADDAGVATAVDLHSARGVT
jgi:flagellar biosynthesis/type III secretory pathway protein FliH